MAVSASGSKQVSLDDKYELAEGTAFMTGLQALVRLPIEQARRDRAAGLRTGVLVSGYPGSPLGGYDLALAQARRWLQPLDVHHVPGLNEELAPATVSELLELGLHGIALSRLTGTWAALKCVTNLCDGGATVRLGPDRPRIVVPELAGFRKPSSFLFLAPGSIELERHLHEE